MFNKPLFIISIALIIASIAMFYFLVIPQINEIKDQESQILTLQTRLDNTTDYFNEIRENSDKLKDLNWTLVEKKMDANFMSGPFYSYNMKNFFEKLILKSGLYLKEMTIGGNSAGSMEGVTIESSAEANDLGNLNEIPIVLNLHGTYPNLKNFLNILSKQITVVGVDKLEVSKNTIESEDGEENISSGLDFKINAHVYSR